MWRITAASIGGLCEAFAELLAAAASHLRLCLWFTQGWDKLGKVFDGEIFLIPAKAVDGTSAASDATSAASAAAETAVEALPVPGFVENIVNWSMDLMFYKADGSFTAMAYVFQTGMVFAELIFGAFLVIGLFTALSSVATVLMNYDLGFRHGTNGDVLVYHGRHRLDRRLRKHLRP